MHDMVLDDRRMKVREIAETIGISTERVEPLQERDNGAGINV
jgi:DNA-binding Xre family transcriptional regulator